MHATIELQRRAAPAPRCQGLAYANGLLWMGSWETHRVYAVDVASWEVREEYAAPERPYGIAPLGADLRVVVSAGNEEDDRYFYRLIPGRGFDEDSRTPCPDMTGSYLASDGRALYLGQMHERRILVLSGDYKTEREIALPARCGGFGFAPDGKMYFIAADDEFEKLEWGTVDAALAQPQFHALAPLPSEARSPVCDGTRWWIALRDENEIASFEL